MHATSIDPDEIERFERLAATWWEQERADAGLHAMNPARLAWIRRRGGRAFRARSARARILAGLRVLDIGCGGGLLCEPLARLGAKVTGIDPAAENIEVARRHAERSGLAIDYRPATVEDLAAEAKASIRLAMEVVEHVADVRVLLGRLRARARPGGFC